MNDDTAYCRDLVARYDHDRHVLTMAAPAAARPALWAIFAFNHEIAKTREVTRDAAAGHIRLAWWRERLDAFYGGNPMPAHDVARALGEAIRAHDLRKDDFDCLLDARALDLDASPPASMDGLMAYVDATNTPLLALCAAVFGVPAPAGLGTAYGLAGIVRALPYLSAQNRCILPPGLMHDIGLMPEQFHHLAPSRRLADAVARIVQLAQASLAQASSGQASFGHVFFKRQIRMTRLYLRRIERAQYNPFDPRVCGPVPFLYFRLMV